MEEKIKEIKGILQGVYEEREKYQSYFGNTSVTQFELKETYQVSLQICNAEYNMCKTILNILEK